MEHGTKVGNPAKTRTQCIIAGVYENNKLSATATLLDEASDGHIAKILKRGDLSGKVNKTLLLHDVPNVSSPRILLVGLGKLDTADAPRFAGIASAVIAQLKQIPAKNALCCLLEAEAGGKDLGWKTSKLHNTE